MHRFLSLLITIGFIMITTVAEAGSFFSGSNPDTLAVTHDSSFSLPPDTLSRQDTLSRPDTLKKKPQMIEDIIRYSSSDSITLDLKQKLAYLIGNAHIEYGDIKIDAYKFIINFNNSSIYAEGTTDSTGAAVGTPVFTQGNLSFTSKTLTYNFETKKGIIQNIVTREGEGYLQSNVVKKLADGSTNSKQGWYTTCENTDHPHFAIKYSKARIIPDDKIVTGPAYLSIEDVPLPLVLPFGIFPSKKGRSSGIVIPKYGESANRGFFLENGGYYFGLNDYFDLKLLGDIYSRGSWAVKPTFTYKRRYKYSGSFNLNYARNVTGVKGSADYATSKDFFVTWSHSQDSKANPNSVFSASVRAGSSKYNRYNNPLSVNDYLTNTFSSSISYSRKLGEIGNITASARHSQNTTNGSVSLSLPEVALTMNRFYPFKRKQATGPTRWYESITVTYNMNARNDLNTVDTALFTRQSLDRFMMGMKHSIPVQGSFKILKYFTWSNGINYNERWYFKTVRKSYISDTTYIAGDTIAPHVQTDTVSEFRAARDYSFNSSVSTTLYGMYQFGKKSPVKAIRHVVRPSVGFNFVPDFTSGKLGYYRTYQDAEGEEVLYSIFGESTFSPYGSPPRGKSGSINFALGNNLEMKVRSKKDTVNGTTKVMLIDNLNFSTNYDLAKDSMRWSNLNISGRTTLFKKIQVNYSSSWSPYAVDSVTKQAYNKFEWEVNRKLFRFENSAWSLSLGYDFRSSDKMKKKTETGKGTADEMEYIRNNPEQFIDWDNPWNLRINYTFRYTGVLANRYTGEKKKTVYQTIDFNGDVSITQKWKVTLRSGYDFKNKDFSLTQVSIYRNLHCWEMSFNWIPYGAQKSWSFAINVKSSVLQDLKLTKKKDFRDSL